MDSYCGYSEAERPKSCRVDELTKERDEARAEVDRLHWKDATDSARKLAAALREERAARLKAEAERDEMQAGGRKAIETCATVIVERDEALALLSRVREAWAKRLRARESMVRWQTDIQREQAARDESTATADLSRLLGEGAP